MTFLPIEADVLTFPEARITASQSNAGGKAVGTLLVVDDDASAVAAHQRPLTSKKRLQSLPYA